MSFIAADLREVAMGSLYLACKIEECKIKNLSRNITVIFDQVFKIHEGEPRPVVPVERNSNRYL